MATNSDDCTSNVETEVPRTKVDQEKRIHGISEPKPDECPYKGRGKYVFELSEREKASKLFHLQYNVASNKYVRVSDLNWEIDGWDSVVYESENVCRTEDHKWLTAYLSQKDGTSKASIQWRFDFINSGLVVDHIGITTYHSGNITWTVDCSFPGFPKIQSFPYVAGKKEMDIPQMKGCHSFTLRADLISDEDKLFSLALNDFTNHPLELIVHFEEMYSVEKVIRGKYIKGKLHYLIKWENYSSRDNTWEPESHLNSSLLRYLEEHPVKITGKPN